MIMALQMHGPLNAYAQWFPSELNASDFCGIDFTPGIFYDLFLIKWLNFLLYQNRISPILESHKNYDRFFFPHTDK